MTVRLNNTASLPAVRYKFSRLFKIIFSAAFFSCCVVVAVLLSFWFWHVHRGLGYTLARILPVPAAIVDGHIVWYSEVVKTVRNLEDEALLTGDAAITRGMFLAERYTVTRRIGTELGVASKSDRLAYDIEVERRLLESTKYQAEARARIERIAAKLAQGIQFMDLATQYSEGASASVGGDLGYVDPLTLPPDLSSVAAAMLPGTVSTITETRMSFWLVQCNEVIENDDGTKVVWLRVIEIKKDLLGLIIDRIMLAADIKEFVR
jgi:hypothetical protein